MSTFILKPDVDWRMFREELFNCRLSELWHFSGFNLFNYPQQVHHPLLSLYDHSSQQIFVKLCFPNPFKLHNGDSIAGARPRKQSIGYEPVG